MPNYSAQLRYHDLPGLAESVTRLAEVLTADGRPTQAGRVIARYQRFLRELDQISRDTANYAKKAILDAERQSRVRDDTGGHGGARLQDSLGHSHPLPRLPGWVGVNDEEPLSKSVPWWWTNEEGYSGHIGRVVRGFFYDQGFTGRARPDPSRFREHPLFRAEGPQGSGRRLREKKPPRKSRRGQRPGMLIKNPIPERRFVKQGLDQTRAYWTPKIKAAEASLIADIEKIVQTGSPRGRRGAGAAGRRP